MTAHIACPRRTWTWGSEATESRHSLSISPLYCTLLVRQLMAKRDREPCVRTQTHTTAIVDGIPCTGYWTTEPLQAGQRQCSWDLNRWQQAERRGGIELTSRQLSPPPPPPVPLVPYRPKFSPRGPWDGWWARGLAGCRCQ